MSAKDKVKEYWENIKLQYKQSNFTNPETFLIYKWIKISQKTKKLILKW